MFTKSSFWQNPLFHVGWSNHLFTFTDAARQLVKQEQFFSKNTCFTSTTLSSSKIKQNSINVRFGLHSSAALNCNKTIEVVWLLNWRLALFEHLFGSRAMINAKIILSQNSVYEISATSFLWEIFVFVFFYFSAYLPSIWQMFSVNNVRDLQSFFGSATSGYLTHILFLVPNLKNKNFSILNCKNFHNIGAKWQLDNFSVTVITLIQFQLKMFSLIQCKRKRVSVVCTSKM